MKRAELNWISGYIWGIADDVLRDLDVREAAAALPDEPDEKAWLDDDSPDDIERDIKKLAGEREEAAA